MAPNVACNLCVTVSKFCKWGTCGKRPILADFAVYHLNNLNGKINGSRRENIRSAVRTQNDKSGCQRVTSSCLFLEGVPTMAPVTFHAWFCFLECIPHSSQSAFLLYFILFEKDLSWPDFLDPVLSFVRWPLLPYDKVFLKKQLTLKFIYIFVYRDRWSLKQLLNV